MSGLLFERVFPVTVPAETTNASLNEPYLRFHSGREMLLLKGWRNMQYPVILINGPLCFFNPLCQLHAIITMLIQTKHPLQITCMPC